MEKSKICQVHDVVLHFCLEKGREEKFMLAVKGHCVPFQPSEWKESRVSFSFSEELPEFASLSSRTASHQHLWSLITTNQSRELWWNPFHQVTKSRFLKVLDLSSYRLRAFSFATLKPLIHLKYLAVSTCYTFHLHQESHLPHLETLIVKDEAVLPAGFWKMKKLRHVRIGKAEFDLEEDRQGMFEESSKLENLRILRNVEFPVGDADRVDVLLRRVPNLQELDISFEGNEDSAEICLKLESLTQLQMLRISFQCRPVISGLHLPSDLKKLVLFLIPIESVIPFIAGLPSLEYLQLTDFGQSKEWCLSKDITFHKLKFLKLVRLRISRWDASEDSFPLLETLVIKECNELEEIPLSFTDIPTLKQIKLIRCKNKSLEVSAENIKEEVTDIEGCDRIDLIISNDVVVYYNSFVAVKGKRKK